jgi:Helix-turn-helix domain
VSFRVALPFYGWRLSGPKPNPAYPLELNHLGDHIRKRRMDLGLTRKALAALLRTNVWTVKGWEEHLRPKVGVRFYPAVIRFLGYNPLPDPTTRGGAVRRERLARGWSIERLAVESGVDPSTIRRIEMDRPRLGHRSVRAVCNILSVDRDF